MLTGRSTPRVPLIARLRGDGVPRPLVSPGLAGGLRDWLEDGLAPVVAGLPPDAAAVRVRKETLNQVLVCEAHVAARLATAPVMNTAIARGTMVDALFRQWVTTGSIADCSSDALAALGAEGDRDGVGAFVAALPEPRRRELLEDVAEHVQDITRNWPVPSPGWLPRTQDRMEVPLAGGRVVLTGTADLAFGNPPGEHASVCVVEVKSGARRLEHRGDLHFYALLETLRSGAPPFRIATYYTRTGELDVEPVGEDVLVGALKRALDGASALCRLAAGAQPTRSANPLCAWCVALPGCAPGQRRAGTDTPRIPGDPDVEDRGTDAAMHERTEVDP